MTVLPLQVNQSAADKLSTQYARFPIVLERGAYTDPLPVRINSGDGREIPHQSEVLAHWPDGSIRVIHGIAPLAGGAYDVIVGGEPGDRNVEKPIRIREDGGDIEVATGRLVAQFSEDMAGINVRVGDKVFIATGGIDLVVEDGEGKVYRAATSEAETEIECSGPIRTVISQSGKCTKDGDTFLNYSLRYEFLAGVEGFSLACRFFNLEPGQDFHNIISMELLLRRAEPAESNYVGQLHHGIFTVKKVAATVMPLEIRVDNTQARAYVANFEALGDETDYPFYLQNGSADIENWAAVGDGKYLLLAEMDDFHLLRPKSLRIEDSTLRYGLWPREAGMLELQQGRSREVTVRVAFCDEEEPLNHGEITARIAQLRDVWRAQLPRLSYAQVDFFDQNRVLDFDPCERPRFEGWLGRMSTGLNSVASFFDLGDTPDTGYKTTYMACGRQRRIRGEDGGMRWFASNLQNPALPMNDLEDFEPVWVNNEYDVIYALGTEYLRTGDLSLFQKLRWFSRHTIEVDFLHYSDHKWLHRAQPAHSARHTTTGAYPSHFWTQGLAQYYLLTGDPDALEVIIGLADKTIENLDDPEIGAMTSGLNREVGWGILSLVCAYEASGDKRYDDYALKLLQDCMAEGIPHDVPVFSFGHTSLMLSARQYLQVHEGEVSHETQEIKKWFLEFIDRAILCSRNAPPSKEKDATDAKVSSYSYDAERAERGALHGGKARPGIFEGRSMALDSFAYAYEISGDDKYITAGLRSLEAMLDSHLWRTPTAEGKPYAMVYRTWINYFKALNDLGLLQQWEYQYR